MAAGFFSVFNQSGGNGDINRVQNVYDDLGLSHSVDRTGSEWVRDVEDTNIVEQSFSDFFGETISQSLSLSSVASPVADRVIGASSTLTMSQSFSVAGGRLVGAGGGGDGDTTNTFEVTYHTGGPSAVIGQIVYIDDADGECKLALNNGTNQEAEVAGFLEEDATSGSVVNVRTEGEIVRSDWTSVAGSTNLKPGATYYLHTGGQMRLTAPASGKVVIVGRAITSTRFDAEINPAWDL